MDILSQNYVSVLVAIGFTSYISVLMLTKQLPRWTYNLLVILTCISVADFFLSFSSSSVLGELSLVIFFSLAVANMVLAVYFLVQKKYLYSFLMLVPPIIDFGPIIYISIFGIGTNFIGL